jgi:glycosyltransferase involved in cell wall biosynthesis
MDVDSLPSFSLILETENLANAELEGLSQALESLTKQDVPPDRANEVILIESGDIPPALQDPLEQRYPWVKIYPAPMDADYYKVKMLGAQLATGAIVVYCDSDCTYSPSWLRSLLEPFQQGDQIQIVAGETTCGGTGAYGTAMALTYIFPQYSNAEGLTPGSQYFLNNVAFRRQFLLDNPIPVDLPLYRGNCVIHACNLNREGHTIWQQPAAKAIHAPPNGLSHFFWRFLLIGHDYYWQNQLLSQDSLRLISSATPAHPDQAKSTSAGGKMAIFQERLGRMFQHNSRHLLYLPLAVPIAAISVLLIGVGYLITSWKPSFLLQTYDRSLG